MASGKENIERAVSNPGEVGDVTQNYTEGAAHVYGLARKVTATGPESAGTYDATEILGFNVVNVGSAGNWTLFYIDGGFSSIGFGDMREGYWPAHLSTIIIPTGGLAEIFIP